MQSKRDYLVNKGLAKPGRGKFSNAAKVELEKAIASGMKFSDATGPIPKPAKPADNGEKAAVSTFKSDIPEPIHSEEEWEAFTIHNDKKVNVGMRTVCNSCHNSLIYCYCATPKVWVDNSTEGMVTFAGRKNPLPNKRW